MPDSDITLKQSTDLQSCIRRRGTVSSVSQNVVCVVLQRKSGCLHCEMSKSCSSADIRNQEVKVICTDANNYQVGETVIIEGSDRIAWRSIRLTFIYPTVILLSSLFIFIQYLHLTEGYATIGAIAILLLYSLIIWLNRHKLSRALNFSIKKLHQTQYK